MYQPFILDFVSQIFLQSYGKKFGMESIVVKSSQWMIGNISKWVWLARLTPALCNHCSCHLYRYSGCGRWKGNNHCPQCLCCTERYVRMYRQLCALITFHHNCFLFVCLFVCLFCFVLFFSPGLETFSQLVYRNLDESVRLSHGIVWTKMDSRSCIPR